MFLSKALNGYSLCLEKKNTANDVLISWSPWQKGYLLPAWKSPWGRFTLETHDGCFRVLGNQSSRQQVIVCNSWTVLPSILVKTPALAGWDTMLILQVLLTFIYYKHEYLAQNGYLQKFWRMWAQENKKNPVIFDIVGVSTRKMCLFSLLFNSSWHFQSQLYFSVFKYYVYRP